MPPSPDVDDGTLRTPVHNDDTEDADHTEESQLADEVDPDELPTRCAVERCIVVAAGSCPNQAQPTHKIAYLSLKTS